MTVRMSSLSTLVKVGFLKTEAFTKLDISNEEIQAAEAKNQRNKEAIKIMQSGDLYRLKSADQYAGTSQNTVTVLQGEGRFIQPDSNTNGMYTFGAGPCLVLVAVSKNAEGEVIRVGLAHIDAATPKSSITTFLNRAKGDSIDLEVSIISGEKIQHSQLTTQLKPPAHNLNSLISMKMEVVLMQ